MQLSSPRVQVSSFFHEKKNKDVVEDLLRGADEKDEATNQHAIWNPDPVQLPAGWRKLGPAEAGRGGDARWTSRPRNPKCPRKTVLETSVTESPCLAR